MNDIESENVGDAAAIIANVKDLVTAGFEPTRYEDAPLVVERIIPEGFRRDTIDLEQYAVQPRRKVAKPVFETAESFCRYVNKHAIEGASTLYAHANDHSVEAIIDDHYATPAGGSWPMHRQHRAVLQLRTTPGYLRWVSAHGKYMDQESFAQLVEDGLTEIARPDGADLLEIAQTMHASTTANFKSGHRLQDGRVQFQYLEEIDARAGADGLLTIPERITLVFSPWFGSDPVQIEARLRYRLNGGKLTFGVWLIQVEEAIRDAFQNEVNVIGVATANAPLMGRSA